MHEETCRSAYGSASAADRRSRDEIELGDGRRIQVRPVEATDAAALLRFHQRLSPETIRRRYFSSHPRLSEAEVERYTTVDHHDREALVAVVDDEIVGVARYDRTSEPTDAEAAFVIDDAWQHHGLGIALVERLVMRARDEDLHRLVAETLSENRAMLGVLARAGFVRASAWDHGVGLWVLSLDS
ncbi:MAG: GNAT family N-acetyltransferase [Acidimicrobiia bacterium]